MKTIPLTKGKVAIVDDEDYALLSKFKWHATLTPDWQSVAAAFNSELAAERERREHAERDACGFQDVNTELLRQLAAERGSRDEFRRALEQRIGEVDELRLQLAAEREVGHNTAVALGQQIIKLEDQLAAERKRADEAERHHKMVRLALDEETVALAAEREKFTDVAVQYEALEKEIQQLREQLAAERKENQTLKQWLADARDDAQPQLVDAIREALASSNPEKVLRAALANRRDNRK